MSHVCKKIFDHFLSRGILEKIKCGSLLYKAGEIWYLNIEPVLKNKTPKKVSHLNSFFCFFYIKVPPDYSIHNSWFHIFLHSSNIQLRRQSNPWNLHTYTWVSWSYLAPEWLSKQISETQKCPQERLWEVKIKKDAFISVFEYRGHLVPNSRQKCAVCPAYSTTETQHQPKGRIASEFKDAVCETWSLRRINRSNFTEKSPTKTKHRNFWLHKSFPRRLIHLQTAYLIFEINSSST